MAVGGSTTNLFNPWLNVIGNKTTFTAPAATYIELHTADPGASGTTAVATTSTRQAATFGAASSNAIALSNSPAFTAAANETITHVAIFSASTAGTFLWSAALTTSRTLATGDTLTFTTLGVSLSPAAA